MKYCVLISSLILANALYAQEPVSATVALSVYVAPNQTAAKNVNTESLDYSSKCAKSDSEEPAQELPEGCTVLVIETKHGDHVHMTFNPI